MDLETIRVVGHTKNPDDDDDDDDDDARQVSYSPVVLVTMNTLDVYAVCAC